MPNPDTIHIGQQTRTLRVNAEACYFAASILPQKGTVREALTTHRDEASIAVLACAAFRAEDKKVSLARVFQWLDAEPGKSKELEAKVVAAYEAYYGHGGHIDAGEEKRPDGDAGPDPKANG